MPTLFARKAPSVAPTTGTSPEAIALIKERKRYLKKIEIEESSPIPNQKLLRSYRVNLAEIDRMLSTPGAYGPSEVTARLNTWRGRDAMAGRGSSSGEVAAARRKAQAFEQQAKTARATMSFEELDAIWQRESSGYRQIAAKVPFELRLRAWELGHKVPDLNRHSRLVGEMFTRWGKVQKRIDESKRFLEEQKTPIPEEVIPPAILDQYKDIGEKIQERHPEIKPAVIEAAVVKAAEKAAPKPEPSKWWLALPAAGLVAFFTMGGT